MSSLIAVVISHAVNDGAATIFNGNVLDASKGSERGAIMTLVENVGDAAATGVVNGAGEGQGIIVVTVISVATVEREIERRGFDAGKRLALGEVEDVFHVSDDDDLL